MHVYLCSYLFLYLSINIFFILLFFRAEYYSRFSYEPFAKNLLRTRSLAVDKLLNGSVVALHGQFIFGGKQSSKLFRGNMAFQQNRRCNFSHFRYMVKTGLLFSFFSQK